MNKEAHLARAKAFERSMKKEYSEREKQYAPIIEAAFMSAFQYINAFLAEKNTHRQNHEGLVRFLRDELGLVAVSEEFAKLESLRVGDVYGGKTNGEASERAVASLNKIKQLLGFKDD